MVSWIPETVIFQVRLFLCDSATSFQHFLKFLEGSFVCMKCTWWIFECSDGVLLIFSRVSQDVAEERQKNGWVGGCLSVRTDHTHRRRDVDMCCWRKSELKQATFIWLPLFVGMGGTGASKQKNSYFFVASKTWREVWRDFLQHSANAFALVWLLVFVQRPFSCKRNKFASYTYIYHIIYKCFGKM